MLCRLASYTCSSVDGSAVEAVIQQLMCVLCTCNSVQEAQLAETRRTTRPCIRHRACYGMCWCRSSSLGHVLAQCVDCQECSAHCLVTCGVPRTEYELLPSVLPGFLLSSALQCLRLVLFPRRFRQMQRVLHLLLVLPVTMFRRLRFQAARVSSRTPSWCLRPCCCSHCFCSPCPVLL